jgi:hypothetical protein
MGMLSSPVINLIMELLPEPVAPISAMILGSMMMLDQFHIQGRQLQEGWSTFSGKSILRPQQRCWMKARIAAADFYHVV